MSVKKATKNNETQYWWGYSLQFNMKTAYTPKKNLIQFMVLKNQDAADPANELNFWCRYDTRSSGNQSGVTADCGGSGNTSSMTELVD